MRPDILKSANDISALVDEYDACVVAGFSQGGAVSLLLGYHLCHPKVVGVAGFSTYAVAFEKKQDIPTFLFHGESDQMVPMHLAI